MKTEGEKCTFDARDLWLVKKGVLEEGLDFDQRARTAQRVTRAFNVWGQSYSCQSLSGPAGPSGRGEYTRVVRRRALGSLLVWVLETSGWRHECTCSRSVTNRDVPSGVSLALSSMLMSLHAH